MQGLTLRVAPLRSATLARRWLNRGAAVVSFAIPAMARPLCVAQPDQRPIERQAPIRVVSVHLLGSAGQLLRVLFLDREGHISGQPNLMPRNEALILAANKRLATRSVAAMAPAAISLDERAWRLSIRPRSSVCRAPSVPCRGRC